MLATLGGVSGKLRLPKPVLYRGPTLIGKLMYRNKKLLEVVRQSPCQHCGTDDGTVVAAHSNSLSDGKGKGIKAHDHKIAALCFRCHSNLDQGTTMSKTERREMWLNAHYKTITWLFESGKIEIKL